MDTTLFIKKKDDDILLVQIYVDDIIFGSTNDSFYKEFSLDMQSEFEMSMMGDLNYLGYKLSKPTKAYLSTKPSTAKNWSKDLGWKIQSTWPHP